MTNVQNIQLPALDTFLYNGKNTDAAFIVLTEKVTPRLLYVCDFIFQQGLLSNYNITDNANEWKESTLYKINYTGHVYENSFQIQPSGFLSKSGIEEGIPPLKNNNDVPLFYPNNCFDIDFDIFSAVFHCISRYEEWQKYVKDMHGRFEVRNSLMYKLSCLKKPIVDLWIEKLKIGLHKKYPDIRFQQRSFKFVSTIDVDNLYAFKGKSLIRNAGGAVKDLFRLDFGMFASRLASVFFGKGDPFDKYDEQIQLAHDTHTPLFYFFLYKNNTEFDRTINPGHTEFKKLFAKLKGNKVEFGIHPSYFSSDDEQGISEETKLLGDHAQKNILISRQHYLRFNIRTTPFYLEKAGISYDFTMGFASAAGYRAGTTLPFYYYDFASEKSFSVMAVPFALMDGAYYIYKKVKIEEVQKDIESLIAEAKKVNGLFITVFHERSFSQQLYPGWSRLYRQIHQLIK